MAAAAGAGTRDSGVPAEPVPPSRVDPGTRAHAGPYRRARRTIVFAVGLAVAGPVLWRLLPSLGAVPGAVAALPSGNPGWLVVAALAAFGTHLASTVSVVAASGRALPLARTLAVEVAAAALNRVTPAGLGRAAALTRYYERSGLDRWQAVTATGTNVAAGAAVHTVALPVAAAVALAGGLVLPRVPVLPLWVWGVASTAGLGLLAGLLGGSWQGRRWLQLARTCAVQLIDVLRRPRSAAALFGGAIGVNAMFTLALYACAHAFGVQLGVGAAAFVYLGASLAAAVVPVPGGLGTTEAALLAGLVASGAAAGPALSAVLAHRLVTHWLPVLPGLWCLRRLRSARYL